ncbi:hypothetical protein ACPW96_20805 [Micromonospora sp. DT81.3]|uniref:hypothetical protein n=1 Tax=Micromonospora sp. DT81.3 TaxID=3416523 RepID=UPI003CF690ED
MRATETGRCHEHDARQQQERGDGCRDGGLRAGGGQRARTGTCAARRSGRRSDHLEGADGGSALRPGEGDGVRARGEVGGQHDRVGDVAVVVGGLRPEIDGVGLEHSPATAVPCDQAYG